MYHETVAATIPIPSLLCGATFNCARPFLCLCAFCRGNQRRRSYHSHFAFPGAALWRRCCGGSQAHLLYRSCPCDSSDRLQMDKLLLAAHGTSCRISQRRTCFDCFCCSEFIA